MDFPIVETSGPFRNDHMAIGFLLLVPFVTEMLWTTVLFQLIFSFLVSRFRALRNGRVTAIVRRAKIALQKSSGFHL